MSALYPFQCSLCDKSFVMEKSLACHESEHKESTSTAHSFATPTSVDTAYCKQLAEIGKKRNILRNRK